MVLKSVWMQTLSPNVRDTAGIVASSAICVPGLSPGLETNIATSDNSCDLANRVLA